MPRRSISEEPRSLRVVAAAEAGREARIIQKHQSALDHLVNIYHPEGEYLKSLLLSIE